MLSEEQEAMFESFRNSLQSMKRDFLARTLYELLSECDRHGIGVALFLEALKDAINEDKKGFEWHQCTMNLERASYGAYEAERIDGLTKRVLKGEMP